MLSAFVAGIVGSLLVLGAAPAARWLWANRSKALSTASTPIPLWMVAILSVLFCVLLASKGCSLPTLPSIPWVVTAPKVTAAVYVHERSKGGIPSHVGTALSKLNGRDILATAHEDGPGAIPKQYEFAVPAAREAGIPSFVTMAADRSVLKVVKQPATEQAVLEAVP